MAVRVAVFALPIVASFLAARMASPVVWHPAGWLGLAVFVVQVGAIGALAALVAERALRNVLPLAELLNLTLVFPDQAPSRFKLALRSGTIRQLKGSLDGEAPADHQEAAEELVAMVTSLGRHEPLTRGHTERVRAYCDLIGDELGLTPHDRQMLSWAALVHDVGKLTVPPEILNSPGRPTDEEWQILRGHPEAGAELVAPLADWLGPWRLAASEHHERWDGSGYPNGLAGTDISLAGRIVAVADAYDVITAKRSYKEALSSEAAREELVRCSGTQFDPTVVRALLQSSLRRSRRNAGFLGWVSEVGLSTVPRAFGQLAGSVTTVVATGTMAAVMATNPSMIAPEPATFQAVDAGAPAGLAFTPSSSSEPDVSEGPSSSTTETPEATTTSEPSTTTDPATVDAEATTTSTTDAPAGDAPTTAPPTTAPLTTLPPSTAPLTTLPPTTAPPTTAPPTTAPPTTTTAPPTTTTTAPPTTSGPTGSVFYLHNPGTGDSTSQTFKTLDTDPVDDATQPNFDTNRDSVPGLRLEPTTSGWSESDLVQIQRFGYNPSSGQQLNGPVRLTLHAALDGAGPPVTVRVALSDCNTWYLSCTNLAETSVVVSADVAGGFAAHVADLGTVAHSFGGGRRLVIRLIAEGSQTVHTAFDSVPYPSALEVTWQ